MPTTDPPATSVPSIATTLVFPNPEHPNLVPPASSAAFLTPQRASASHNSDTQCWTHSTTPALAIRQYIILALKMDVSTLSQTGR
ncbi:hypothetical protein D9756_010661 [Leucocoprinus leucothites]|uniref:Uncharacterized protein n=1 Tax=Leucocoprinus leucothites TaxID=201217 RepID=A0A8H5CVV4_9AGAR|nr:hypothetical protein D9756_010661 [Leucoagaricus leucothites]